MGDGPKVSKRPKFAARKPANVSHSALIAAAGKPRKVSAPFKPYAPAPGVVPAGQTLAMDEAPAITWAASDFAQIFAEGEAFLGYPYLAELATRPEYRVITETIATEMTRKWVKFQAQGNDKTEKLQAITEEFNRLKVRDAFEKCAVVDGFFGRSHLFLDFGVSNDPAELKADVGTGQNATSTTKIAKGALKAVRAIEPVWCYPTGYNSNNPLAPDWYKPSVWFVMGKEIHGSRLLTFIGHEVPDLLKPAYSFGGLSLSQMAKPYVNNWLRTRQSVADLLHSFSVFLLKTDMQSVLSGGEAGGLMRRVDLFNAARDNRGLMVVNKDTEDFANISAPLGTLDALQAQTQEHMASVSRIPLVKLTGISPSGLNASSDGEIRVFYDFIAAYQQAFFAENLQRVLAFVQLSLFGAVDPAITFMFEPLHTLTTKERAEVRKLDAETDQIQIDSGVLAAAESRQRVANDPETPYAGLDVDDVPDLAIEEEEGLEPKGESKSE